MEDIQLKGIYIKIDDIFIKDVDNKKDNIELRSTMYAVSNENNIYEVNFDVYVVRTLTDYYTERAHYINFKKNEKIDEPTLTENYIQIYNSEKSKELLKGIFNNQQELRILDNSQKSIFKEGKMVYGGFLQFNQKISTLQEEGNPKYKQKVLILLINFINLSLKDLDGYFSKIIEDFNNTQKKLNKIFQTTDDAEDIDKHVKFLNLYKEINIPQIDEEKNKLFAKEEEILRTINIKDLNNKGKQEFEEAENILSIVREKKKNLENLNLSKIQNDTINSMESDILSKIDGKFAYSRTSKTLFNEFKKYLEDKKIPHTRYRIESTIKVVDMDANLRNFFINRYEFDIPVDKLSKLPAESNIRKRIKGSSNNGEFPIVQQPVAVQPVVAQPVAVQPVVAQPVAVQPVVPKIGYNRYPVHYT